MIKRDTYSWALQAVTAEARLGAHRRPGRGTARPRAARLGPPLAAVPPTAGRGEAAPPVETGARPSAWI